MDNSCLQNLIITSILCGIIGSIMLYIHNKYNENKNVNNDSNYVKIFILIFILVGIGIYLNTKKGKCSSLVDNMKMHTGKPEF